MLERWAKIGCENRQPTKHIGVGLCQQRALGEAPAHQEALHAVPRRPQRLHDVAAPVLGDLRLFSYVFISTLNY